ncbi:unnamed protein product [Kuraishia capsulata CBS 1993]|uniref:Uncharacterized protein n=1 Tax=Kuraishia capsulata CBS 1993 TaxID=1382522 RepID=W6MPZ8_9ASCO|nr:uncharacterized protein KUCA_T00004784001 [Kuraishia capsulata CBS 1993]CDK28799.1 unnamed protein product [Kuraishia capsulata CBS 1993]
MSKLALPLFMRRTKASLSHTEKVSFLDLLSVKDDKLANKPAQSTVNLKRLEHNHFDGITFALNHIRDLHSIENIQSRSDFLIDHKRLTLKGVPIHEAITKARTDETLVRIFDELLLTEKLTRDLLVAILMNPNFQSMPSILKKLKRSTMFLTNWTGADKRCVELAVCHQKSLLGDNVQNAVEKRKSSWISAIQRNELHSPYDRIAWQLLLSHLDVQEIADLVLNFPNHSELLFSAWIYSPRDIELLSYVSESEPLNQTCAIALRLIKYEDIASSPELLQLLADCTKYSFRMSGTIDALRWSEAIRTFTSVLITKLDPQDKRLVSLVDELNEMNSGNTRIYNDLKLFIPSSA